MSGGICPGVYVRGYMSGGICPDASQNLQEFYKAWRQ